MDAKGLQQSQQALTEANRKLEEQIQKANALALEKQALQTKLDSLIPSQWNAGTLDSTRKALAEANTKLAHQTEIATRLASEKEALQSRVKTLSADNEAVSALRAENLLLKKQVAEFKVPPVALAKGEDPARKVAEAKAQLA